MTRLRLRVWLLESSFSFSVTQRCVNSTQQGKGTFLRFHHHQHKICNMPKTVAVIGAGPSGLAAIKCCLEAGLQPIAFESDPWLGGIWKYTDLAEETEPRSCVASSTITNTSKHMSCFSDFPMPKEWPNYLPQHKYLEYFQMYAKQFNLEETIHFESKVTAVEPCPDFSRTGRWRVHFYEKKLNEERVEEFDFVMVCTGVSWDPRMPHIPGLDGFTGEVIHSKEYRTWKKFEGKRVIVFGLGNSAGKTLIIIIVIIIIAITQQYKTYKCLIK